MGPTAKLLPSRRSPGNSIVIHARVPVSRATMKPMSSAIAPTTSRMRGRPCRPRRCARNTAATAEMPPTTYESQAYCGRPSSCAAPLDALVAHPPRLRRRDEVVAYCRGPYCVYADDAVRLLRDRGYRARRLDVGFPEWRRAGLPVEISARGVA